jgi:hypothetical protein
MKCLAANLFANERGYQTPKVDVQPFATEAALDA